MQFLPRALPITAMRYSALAGAVALALTVEQFTGCSMLSRKKTAPAPRPSSASTAAAAPKPSESPVAAIATPQATPDASVVQPPRDNAPHQTVARLIASVDGEPITGHDLEQFSAALGRPVKADDIANNDEAKDALKAMIAQKLVEKEVQQYSSKVDEEQVDNYIEEVRREKHLTPEQMKAGLAQSGVSMEDFRKHAREELEKEMMIRQQVRQKVDVSPAEIQAFYDQHKQDFTVTVERLKIAQILVGVPENANPQQVAMLQAKAEKIRKEAASGTDFSELAHKYSDDESKNAGGELGWFSPGDIKDQIYNAVKGLKPGEISQLVRTEHGFHILKLEDHEVPGVRPLADVKGLIRNQLVNQKANAQLQSWIDTDLVKQHDVETFY
jgi:peptidyl-prolyl cis-trans isomerase SurA